MVAPQKTPVQDNSGCDRNVLFSIVSSGICTFATTPGVLSSITAVQQEAVDPRRDWFAQPAWTLDSGFSVTLAAAGAKGLRFLFLARKPFLVR